MSSLDDFCRDKLSALDASEQRRSPVPTRRLKNARVERVVDGVVRTLIDFSSNDTLGLAHHGDVVAAARAALDDGVGSGGSRLVSGSHPRLAALEERLAVLHHQPAALVTGAGWLANIGVVPALVGEHDVVVIDALAHASLFSAARASRARVVVFPHNDVAAAGVMVGQAARAARARDAGARLLLVTESVFSMDGDRAPLGALAALCAEHDAWLLVDDAHGFLVGGDDGDGADDVDGGVRDACGDVARAHVVTGTLSKAVGGYGGVVAGSRALIDLLFTRCRPVLFGTALPPAVVAAAHAALDVAAADPALRARPRALARSFCATLGLSPPASHIVPLVVGAERAALALMRGLADDGFLVVAIRPPTVPAGTSRLRVSFSAVHTDADVDALAAAIVRRAPPLASLSFGPAGGIAGRS